MSLSNPNKPVTEQRLQEFYHKIEPYMGNSGGGTGGGHTIEDSEGTALTQRDTLQFGDGLNVSDDNTNSKTVVEPNLMVASDMDDVVTPLPSVQSRYQKYSTEEQIVGKWIDGKTVFQRTFDCGYGGEARTNVYTPITSSLSEIETVVDVSGFCRTSRGDTWPINTAFINWQTFNVEGFGSVFVTVLGTSPNQYYGIAIRTSDKDLTSCHFYVTVRYTKPTY